MLWQEIIAEMNAPTWFATVLLAFLLPAAALVAYLVAVRGK